MGKMDARIDVYINKAADYAKPVLMHLRDLIHKASPDIDENIKWGMPAFEYKGFLCGMAAFKNHCAFNFWKGSVLPDPDGILKDTGESGMGNLGRIQSLKDLPSDKIMLKYIKEAMKLNAEGIKVPKKKTDAEREELIIPDYFTAALRKNKLAHETFNNFSYSHKRDYIEWITEAKTESTRQKRIDASVEWLSEGKPRMWKYMKTKSKTAV